MFRFVRALTRARRWVRTGVGGRGGGDKAPIEDTLQLLRQDAAATRLDPSTSGLAAAAAVAAAAAAAAAASAADKAKNPEVEGSRTSGRTNPVRRP